MPEYILKGDEIKQVLEEKCPCGKSVTTAYFHAETGVKVRQDVEIKVDPDIWHALIMGARPGVIQ